MESSSQPPAEDHSPQQPPDDHEAASQSISDYVKDVQPYQQNKRQRRHGFLILIIVMVLLGGGAIAYIVLKPKSPPPPAPSTQNTSASEQSPSSITVTKHYMAQHFPGLEFDYPDNWTVSEPETGNQITVRSKTLKLKHANGQTVNGQIIFSIQPKGTQLPQFTNNTPTAVLESDKIAYTRPSPSQRGSTYVSYLRFNKSSPSGLDAVYITGDKGYQVGQDIPKTDFDALDPIISVAFVQCQNNDCSSSAAMSLKPSSWASDAVFKQVNSMLRSLIVS